jgi:hypothetical protein
MLIRRGGVEVGVGIDDQAAIVIDGDSFSVVASSSAGASVRVTKKIVYQNPSDEGAIKEKVFVAGPATYALSDLVEP